MTSLIQDHFIIVVLCARDITKVQNCDNNLPDALNFLICEVNTLHAAQGLFKRLLIINAVDRVGVCF